MATNWGHALLMKFKSFGENISSSS